MRSTVILLPLLLLAGCKDEPDFEARYDKAAEEIEARAKAMDAAIAESEEAAAAATRLAEEAASLSQAVSLFNFGKMPPPRRVAMPGSKGGAANTGKPAALKRLAA